MSSTPAFGIVIPTLDAGRTIDRLLTSISAQSLDSYSVVVVDEGSTDRTLEIAQSFDSVIIRQPRPAFYSPPSRSRNLGARAIASRILLHLDADMELGSPDFLARLQMLFDNDHRAVILEERDVARGYWANCKAVERLCYRGTRMESARAVTRDLFEAAGGYDERVSSGEDFLITRHYAAKTLVTRSSECFVYHHIGSPSLRDLLVKKFRYGRTAKTYFDRARQVQAMSPAAIIATSLRAYLSNWRLIRYRPAEYIGVLPLRILEMAAVQMGALIGGRPVREKDGPVKSPQPDRTDRLG